MKIKPATVYFFIAVCSTLLIGCHSPRYVYSPSAQNIPILTQKGDSKLSALYSTNWSDNSVVLLDEKPVSNGVDIQSAYAISNHWAVQANYFYRNEQNGDYVFSNEDALIRYRRSMVEIAVGYYRPLNDAKTVFFQVFGGIGKGRFSFRDYAIDSPNIQYANFHRADVIKFSVQPAVMFQKQKHLAFSVSSRFSFLDYSRIKTDYDSSKLALFELAGLNRGPVIFWEPSFVFNWGLKKFPFLRLEVQSGVSALVNKRFVDSKPFNFSIGVQADMVNLLKKKPKKKG